jgi:hypothetical protein
MKRFGPSQAFLCVELAHLSSTIGISQSPSGTSPGT